MTMAHRRSSSYDAVWRAVQRIPRGRVTTYGMIARGLGLEGQARFVGYALHHLPPGTDVPWHRVVGAGGRISLAGNAGRVQRRLLNDEGISFSRDRIDMEHFGWTPAVVRRLRD